MSNPNHVPAGSPDGGQFTSGPGGDAGGGGATAGASRKERFKAAVDWVKTAAAQRVFTGDNVKAAAAIGIKSALYHGLQFDDAMMNTIEDYVHVQVHNAAATARVAPAMAREAMLSSVNRLIELRQNQLRSRARG
jgi:hypothetical protein